MRTMTSYDLSEYLYNEKHLRWYSGKFFINDKEIKNISRYCLAIPEVRSSLKNVNDLNKLTDSFINAYGEEKKWPEMPIIEKARRQTGLKPLAFPLTHKQLVLINRIISGDSEYMYILTGCGGSGKSTYANIICQIFENDVAPLTLSDLSDDFKRASGVDKRLIYADELNSDDLNNGAIKTIISKQCITVNPKNIQPYRIVWQGTLFFSCNRVPRLDLTDSGIVRRICYFSMNDKIENPDPTLQKKQYTEEELVNIVAHALRVDTKNWFDLFKYETRELLRKNNSVWICKNAKGLASTEYYDYTANADMKGLRKMSEPKFQEIKDLLLEWEKEEEDDLPF